jgi:PII-like signaling protein
MKKESDAILMRIFIGESDKYEGIPLSRYLVELFKKEGLAGATVLRGISGYGKSSHLHTTSILRLSNDLPIVIEVVDRKENIERIKPKLDDVIEEGMITEEEVKIILYEGRSEVDDQ